MFSIINKVRQYHNLWEESQNTVYWIIYEIIKQLLGMILFYYWKKNKFTAHFTQMRLTTMKLVLNLIKQSFIIKIPICSSDVTNSPGSFNQKWFCIDWLIKLKLIYYLYYSYKQYVSYLSSYCIFDMKPYEARLKLCYYKLLME